MDWFHNIEEIKNHNSPTDIEKTLTEFEEIDFSLILQNSFHVTLDKNNLILLKKGNLNYFRWKDWKPSRMDVENNAELDKKSLNAFENDDNLLNHFQIPKSLFCPFCADEYMFEFTLKDHLRRKHSKESVKRQQNENVENEIDICPYCNASFYVLGLVPKHIAKYHGRNWLNHWQHQMNCKNLLKSNSENSPKPKHNQFDFDNSETIVACSPGLSAIFEKLITKDFTDSPVDSPLKSILKKTPKYQDQSSKRIIHSPSSLSIKRNKSEIMKRSTTVRRELRFDLPPLQSSPPQVVRKHRKLYDLCRLFRFRKTSKNISYSPNKNQKNDRKLISGNFVTSPYNITTSTPINFIDEKDDLKKSNKKKYVSKKFSSKKIMSNQRPLLFSSERYQCGCCNMRYENNPDLLMHLKEKHRRSAKYLLKQHYKCGQCGTKFFRNSYLVRHCHFQHTPQRI